MRRYAHVLQKMGWHVQLNRIDVQMISASLKVEGPLEMPNIVKYYRGNYEPEQFPAAMFVRDSVHFTCFHSGTVLMAGIKERKKKQLYDVCIPILIELPLLKSTPVGPP